MHFHFAFTMAILALYNDWKPIIFISLLYGLHHIAFLVYEPSLLFSHVSKGASLFSYFGEFVIHVIAVVILAIPLALIVFWGKRAILNLEKQKKITEEQSELLSQKNMNSQKIASDLNSYINSLNSMLETTARSGKDIDKTLTEVKMSIDTQSSSVFNINNHMTDILRQIQDTSEESREINISTDNMEKYIKDGKNRLSKLVHHTGELSRSIDLTSKTVSELEEQTRLIQGILSSISQIAKQTNLLSLNAAIEAERAGEQGRGFGVVANEIGKLAEETTRSSSKIFNILSNISSQVSIVAQNISKEVLNIKESREYSEQVIDTFDKFVKISRELSTRADKIDSLSSQVEEKASAISSELTNISALTEESTASMEQISVNIKSQIASNDTNTEISRKINNINQKLILE